MSEHNWDERWVQFCEMKAGVEDPFDEFADKVKSSMEAAGNQVGRPLVMKVTIEVNSGELARPDFEENND